MQSDFYKCYIRSDEWEEKKAQRMELDGYKCVMCGRPKANCRSMQVHHVTYKNLGHEDILSDLCTLCGSCHKKIHNYLNRTR